MKDELNRLEETKNCTEEQFTEILEIASHHAKPFTQDGVSGIQSRSRGTTMGTVWLNTKPPIVMRGYPKLPYADDNIIHLMKNVNLLKNLKPEDRLYIEEKYDGTNLAILYDERVPFTCCGIEHLWVKTRLSITAGSFKDTLFQDELKSTIHFPLLLEAVKNSNHIIYVEIFGGGIGSEFVRYTNVAEFRVIDVVSRETFKFLTRKEKEDFCDKWHLEVAELILDVPFYGTLGEYRDAIVAIEEQSNKLNEDGVVNEGYMMKLNCSYLDDQEFGKVKGETVKKICWGLSARDRKITKNTISRSLLKARRDYGLVEFRKIERETEIKNYVIDDLLEDWGHDKIYIEASLNDDLEVVYSADTRTVTFELNQLILDVLTVFRESIEVDVGIIDFLKEIRADGINIEKKGVVMSMLAKKFPAMRTKGADLYNKYRIAVDFIRTKEKEKKE